MRIAVLGWGSLVWNPGGLRIEGDWHQDGPLLPIEFARISSDGRLTLVLCPGAGEVPALWAQSAYASVNEAVENLREREGTRIQDSIGFLDVRSDERRCRVVPEILPRIRRWVREKHLDAVIWTDLLSNFKGKTRKEFDVDNVIEYLKGLRGETLANAREYVQRAPVQVATKFRLRLEEELGWTQA